MELNTCRHIIGGVSSGRFSLFLCTKTNKNGNPRKTKCMTTYSRIYQRVAGRGIKLRKGAYVEMESCIRRRRPQGVESVDA